MGSEMCIRDSITTLQGTAGISLATTNITVTDQVDKSEADTINGYTTGQVVLNSASMTVTELAAVEALDDSVMKFADDGAISVSDAASLTNANTINNYTTGQVTLTSVDDTVANITSIDGLTTTQVSMAAATVSIADTGASKTQVDTVNGFTTGTVTPTSISCLLYTSPSPRDIS